MIIKVVGRRTALARAIILTDILRQNIEAEAIDRIVAELERLLDYHVNRLSDENKEVFSRFQYCLFFHNGRDRQAEIPCDIDNRDCLRVEGYGLVVSITEKEYKIEKKVRIALANKSLKDSGFFGLVKRVVEEG